VKSKLKPKGLVQIYTGDRKGKTTAALGQGMRAAGRQYIVYMIQFLKGIRSGELDAVQHLCPYFQIFRFGQTEKFFYALNEEEKKQCCEDVRRGCRFALEVMKKRECDMLILDEIMGALHNQLITIDEACHLIHHKPEQMELILTGRDAPQELIELADYVSEIKMVKHPFLKGMKARKGIEY